jgi:hypothetical protein
LYIYKKLFMIYLITKIDDEDVVIGEITGYSMFSGAGPSYDIDKEMIKEVRFSYQHKRVKEWVEKTESIEFITIWSKNGSNTVSKCKRIINDDGYATYSYTINWPVYTDFNELTKQFNRDQKIEDILE